MLPLQSKGALPKFNYFCIFCPEKKTFDSALDATKHYGEHLNYRPVICILCSQKFADVKSVTDHHAHYHSEIHPAADLLYYINEDEHVEKWVKGFLMLQKQYKIWQYVDASYVLSCVVCSKLFKSKPKTAKNELSEDHILRHLNYITLECVLCDNDNKYKPATVGSQALEHLRTAHDAHVDVNEAKDIFRKVFKIEALEQFVREHVVRWRHASGAFKRKANDEASKEKTEVDLTATDSSVSANPLITQLSS